MLLKLYHCPIGGWMNNELWVKQRDTMKPLFKLIFCISSTIKFKYRSRISISIYSGSVLHFQLYIGRSNIYNKNKQEERQREREKLFMKGWSITQSFVSSEVLPKVLGFGDNSYRFIKQSESPHHSLSTETYRKSIILAL